MQGQTFFRKVDETLPLAGDSVIVKHEMEDFSSVAQQYIVSKLRLILDVLQEERDGFMARVQSQIADLTNLVDTKQKGMNLLVRENNQIKQGHKNAIYASRQLECRVGQLEKERDHQEGIIHYLEEKLKKLTEENYQLKKIIGGSCKRINSWKGSRWRLSHADQQISLEKEVPEQFGGQAHNRRKTQKELPKNDEEMLAQITRIMSKSIERGQRKQFMALSPTRTNRLTLNEFPREEEEKTSRKIIEVIEDESHQGIYQSMKTVKNAPNSTKQENDFVRMLKTKYGISNESTHKVTDKIPKKGHQRNRSQFNEL